MGISGMHLTRRAAAPAIALVVAMAAACGPPPRAIVLESIPAREPAPAVPSAELPMDQIIIPTQRVTPLPETPTSTRRINLIATNAPVREILPELAAAAGVSIVMAPDVTGRITVALHDVPAMDALRAVIDQAGLTIGPSYLPNPFGPVVFYQIPVNVNTASAETIKARYGVQQTTADWIAKGRNW
jgi:hypothetical protein